MEVGGKYEGRGCAGEVACVVEEGDEYEWGSAGGWHVW